MSLSFPGVPPSAAHPYPLSLVFTRSRAIASVSDPLHCTPSSVLPRPCFFFSRMMVAVVYPHLRARSCLARLVLTACLLPRRPVFVPCRLLPFVVVVDPAQAYPQRSCLVRSVTFFPLAVMIASKLDRLSPNLDLLSRYARFLYFNIFLSCQASPLVSHISIPAPERCPLSSLVYARVRRRDRCRPCPSTCQDSIPSVVHILIARPSHGLTPCLSPS